MPNDVAANQYSLTIIDRDSEKSSTTANILQSVDNPAYVIVRDAFEQAVDGVTNGNRFRREASLPELLGSSVAPSNNSFREDKWLLKIEDTVTFRRYTLSIATADPSLVTLIPGEDKMDLTVGPGLALKDAVEEFIASPAGNGVTLVEVEYVGRNI